MTNPLIVVIPNQAQIAQITYMPDFSAVCSIGHAPFTGWMEITYQPADCLLEFESFEAWLHAQAILPTTIENLARLVLNSLTAVMGDIPLRVTLHATTTVHGPVSATLFNHNEDLI